MRDDLRSRIRRWAKSLLISAFLGLSLGYATFYAVFPNVSMPAEGEPSFLLIVGILAAAAFTTGLVTDDLPQSMAQSILAIPIGIGVAFGLAVSPALTGFLEVQIADIFAFVARFGFPVYLLSVPLFFVASLGGLLLRARLGLRSASYLRGHAAAHRK